MRMSENLIYLIDIYRNQKVSHQLRTEYLFSKILQFNIRISQRNAAKIA